MATIVREGRPNWWAPIAANVIGGLLNRWQESERNKKANALMGEMAAQLQGFANGSQNTPQLTQAQSQGTGLLNPSMPESYNDNGWADAFHKTDTPLTQFDLGTAGATPSAVPSTVQVSPLGNSSNALANALAGANNPIAQYNTGVTGLLGANAGQSATQQRLPTPMDIYNVWANLVGSKRFRSVNPQTAQEILAPYLKMNEQARLEQRQKDLADAYMNAGSDTDRLNQMFSGAIQGIVPEAMLGRAQNRYQYDNPYSQPYTQNTGKTTRYGTFNPRTGEYTQAGEYDVTTTPAQDLAHQLGLLQLEAQKAQNRAQMDYNYAQLRQNGDLESRRLDIAERPNYTIQATGDGKLYWVDGRNQTIRPVEHNGQHLDALPKDMQGGSFSEADKQYINHNNARVRDLQKEVTALEQRAKDANGESKKELIAQINAKQAEIARIRKANSDFINSRRTWYSQSNSNNNNSNGQTLPPVFPPVKETLTTQEFNGLLREVEREGGKDTEDGRTIHNREELYQWLREQDVDVENSRQSTPTQQNSPTVSPDVTVLGSNDITPSLPSSPDVPSITSPDMFKTSWSMSDFLPNFGATPAYADENMSSDVGVLDADRNSDARIQKALDSLNGQFNEEIFSDWSSGLALRGSRDMTTNLPYTDPNKPMNVLGLPLIYPNGDYNRYALFGGKDLADRDILNRTDPFHNVIPIPSTNESVNSGRYSSIINRQAKAHDVDPDLIAAIIQQESGGNSRAVSSVGAQGLMQLMPKTARGLGVTDSFDPEQNIAGGTKYIAQMLKRYNGDIEKALWAYNAGPGNADKGRLPKETKDYISSVMSRYRSLKSGNNTVSTVKPQKTSRKRKAVRARRAKRTTRRARK